MRRALLMSCAATLALGAGNAFAQTAPAAAPATTPDTGGSTLAEVVVTAQNRAQTTLNVPIKMDVISGQQLERAGFKSVADLDKVAPVVMIQNDQGSLQVTVRGVGNTAGGNTDNSVVTNIDGEYINRPAALSSSLFDLDRAEVLRGPQGTLYGRNATGGAVNFIVRKPSQTFGGDVEASYGNYNSQHLDGAVNIPLIPQLALRVAGFYDYHDGYTSSPALPAGNYGGFNFPGYSGGRSDTNRALGFRGSFLADNLLSDRLTIYGAVEYVKRDFTPQAFDSANTRLPQYNPGPTCNLNGWAPTAPLITNQTLCIPANTNFLAGINRADYAAPANGFGHQYWDTYAARGRVDYKFNDAVTFTYIGGYRHFNIDPRSTQSLPVVYASDIQYDFSDTQSHEARLSGNVNGIIYQFGGFYFSESVRHLGGFYLGDITPNSRNFGLWINTQLRDSDNQSKSAFGQVEVPLPVVSNLTAVGGVRYTDNNIDGYWKDKPNSAFFAGSAPRPESQLGPAQLLHEHEDKVTWLAGLNYKLDMNTLVYGKVSTGFKAGGFDAVGTYGPETNEAYEVGLKRKFGDHGQHFFNLTGFYYDYTGLQVNVLLSSAEGGRTFNAGHATVWGIEGETQYEIFRDTHLNLTVNYLNARLDELHALYNVYCVTASAGGKGNCLDSLGQNINSVGDLDPNTPGIQAPNFAGHTPAYSPNWIVTAGLDHSWDLGPMGRVTARVNTTFKSKYYTVYLNYEDEAQKPFTQTDVTVDYQMSNGILLSAYARNLEDVRPLTQAYFLSAGPDNIWNWEFGAPRTYGIRAAYRF